MREDELSDDQLPPLPPDKPIRDNDRLAAALASMKVPTIPTGVLEAALASINSPAMKALRSMSFKTPPTLTAIMENAAKYSISGATSTSLVADHQKMMESLVRASEPSYSLKPIDARIFVNPLIGLTREQIESQERTNEELAKNNDALGRVITTLETELAESRAETKSSHRNTRMALAIAAVTMLVSLVLGIAALIK